MTQATLHQTIEKKGTFQLLGTIAEVQDGINGITAEYAEWNDSEFESQEAYDKFVQEESSLNDDQKADLAKFRAFLNPEYNWEEAFNRIPRKANGTFAKNRVVVLAQGHAFSWESEEEYG